MPRNWLKAPHRRPFSSFVSRKRVFGDGDLLKPHVTELVVWNPRRNALLTLPWQASRRLCLETRGEGVTGVVILENLEWLEHFIGSLISLEK